jgi:cell division protein FtsB
VSVSVGGDDYRRDRLKDVYFGPVAKAEMEKLEAENERLRAENERLRERHEMIENAAARLNIKIEDLAGWLRRQS